MRCVINNIESFKACFKGIDTITDNINFSCNKKEMRYDLLDKTHTVFISCVFERGYFTEYEIKADDVYSVDATEFNKVLKKCKGDEVILEFDESLTLKNGSKKFTLNLLEEEYGNIPSLPLIDYKYDAEVSHEFFKESLSDCEMYSDDVMIHVEGDDVTFYSAGVLGEYQNTFTDEEMNAMACDGKYRIEKLKVLDTKKISNIISLQGGEDVPILVTAANVPQDLTLRMMIAPIIGEDE